MDVNADVFLNQEDVPVIVLKEFEIDTYVKGHHVYKDTRSPEIDQSLDCANKTKQLSRQIRCFLMKIKKRCGKTFKERSNW